VAPVAGKRVTLIAFPLAGPSVIRLPTAGHNPAMAFSFQRVRRLWQPREPLFWVVVMLNAFSSVMTTALWVLQPKGLVLVLVVLLALLNSALGLLMLARLWHQTENPPR